MAHILKNHRRIKKRQVWLSFIILFSFYACFGNIEIVFRTKKNINNRNKHNKNYYDLIIYLETDQLKKNLSKLNHKRRIPK